MTFENHETLQNMGKLLGSVLAWAGYLPFFHGQRLFVSPGLDLVIVHYASQIVSPAVPPVPLIQAFHAIGTHLQG